MTSCSVNIVNQIEIMKNHLSFNIHDDTVIQKKVQCISGNVTGEDEKNAQAGLLSEFNEAQAFQGSHLRTNFSHGVAISTKVIQVILVVRCLIQPCSRT